MPKLTDTAVPQYRRHKSSGQAVVTLDGHDRYLGRYNSASSKAEYNRLVGEWLAAGRRLPRDPLTVTIVEIMAAYLRHAESYYRRPDGTPTREVPRIKMELRPLKALYGRTAAADFGPLALKATRAEMIRTGWNRCSCNHGVGTIKRMFKWATENELIPPHVHQALAAVAGLRAGRSDAPESEPVRPVPQAYVDAALPHLSRHVGAMVRLQLVTGMRPHEVCIMRGCDLDVTGKLWVYRPAVHKTQHHGHTREVYLGPRAQDIVKPFLCLNPEEYLFQPGEAEAEQRGKRHEARKTPMNQGNRPRSRHVRKFRDHYDVASYRRAIARACEAADVETWAPGQLRHTAATNLRKEFGLEAAQVILGHKTLTVTQVYAERNVVPRESG